MPYLTAAKIAEIGALLHAASRPDNEKLLTEVAAAIAADAAPSLSVYPFHSPGANPLSILRVANAVKDGETVVVDGITYEVVTDDTIPANTASHVYLDLNGGTVAKMQGTLSVPVQPTAGETFTIGTKVYTFVPAGTANADGEVPLGANVGATQPLIVAAINGTDGWNTAHTLVSAGAFAANNCVITALKGGIATIATTETMAGAGNQFDAATLGTTTAGVDPTADEFVTALVAAIGNTGAIVARKISANEMLLVGAVAGALTTGTTETLAGANNAFDTAAMRGGQDPFNSNMARFARVPNATEVALGNVHIPLPFQPFAWFVQVRVTATGALKAWDGQAYVTSAGVGSPFLTIDNTGGAVDFAASDTIHVLAIE